MAADPFIVSRKGRIVAEPQQEMTLLLGRLRSGDERARDELVALVYDELRRVASCLMRRERAWLVGQLGEGAG
jgi:hypothetical protein